MKAMTQKFKGVNKWPSERAQKVKFNNQDIYLGAPNKKSSKAHNFYLPFGRELDDCNRANATWSYKFEVPNFMFNMELYPYHACKSCVAACELWHQAYYKKVQSDVFTAAFHTDCYSNTLLRFITEPLPLWPS